MDLIKEVGAFIIFLYMFIVSFNIVKVKDKFIILKNPSILLKIIIVMGLIVFAILIIYRIVFL